MEPLVLGTWEGHRTLGLGSWGILRDGGLCKRCFHRGRGSQSTDTKFQPLRSTVFGSDVANWGNRDPRTRNYPQADGITP